MERARFYDPRTGVTQEVDVEYYAGEYSESGFWEKIKSKVKSAGLQLIYKAMQLYYATENPNCPTKVKAGIYAALGYFIAPFDFLPDFMPFAGYTDDLSAILLATMMAQAYIDDEVREKSRQKLGEIFGRKILAELSEDQAA
ncbi:MAG: DUF1232 domain-containing protein [Schwartzia sp.]|nr:DUF1232 domain-containing protein [Schwartzia sp. (in: firmicutes)]MBR5162661.1 DUF1232 domain-containing protein [Schwartzia sp. (in: firmicutes)]